MTKVIIISDTHYCSIERLSANLLNKLKEADIVVHAGDADTLNFIDELNKICKSLYAVKGNCDIGSTLPLKLVEQIEGIKIGVSHGTGNYNNIIDRLYYMFSDDNPDIIIYGHTHVPINEDIEGIHFINPGSTTLNRTLNNGTYALLTIDGNNFNATIENAD